MSAPIEDRCQAAEALRFSGIINLTIGERESIWRVIRNRLEPADLRAEAIESLVCLESRRGLAARRFAILVERESRPKVVFWAAYAFSLYGRARECALIRNRLLKASEVLLSWRPFPSDFPT